MVFMAYTFLEIFRVSTMKMLKLKTIGDTIGYFRQQYLVDVDKFAYSCTVKGVTLESVIAKLRKTA